MASSSTPSSSSHLIPSRSSRSSFKSWDYEVFLNFRGEDTSQTFVDHLYTSLVQQGIHTYKDDETLPLGESIGPSILKAIGESRIAVIVFSENYADSSWCLDELAYIMECMTTRGLIVMPVFYDVDPSDVRKQKGKYGEAFGKHELENNHKVKLWKNALAAAGNLSGWVTKDYANGHEEECIKDIVGSISSKLYPINSKVSKDLIGIDTRLQDLKSKLETGSSGGVRIIGIWGIGGGGKTTLASAAYTEMSVHFEGHCFLANIREESNKHGLKMLQKNMLLSILKTEVPVESEEEGRSMIKTRLCHKKVLVVLDDVDDLKQIEDLAGSHNWFGEGSRIIITTRNEHVLTRKADSIYEVSLLSHDEAIELFHTHAYWEDNPGEDYEILSEKVVSYAGGLPLVLEILGKFLYNKDKDEWKSALTKLKDNPDPDVMERLKISYDGLNPDEKDLFLDIACFHRKRTPIDDAMKVLDACRFNPVIGVRVLVQKSLIYESNGVFDMHDLIEEMAHHIVREEHPKNPEKHSRVWKYEDLLHICAMDATKENDRIQALVVSNESYPPCLPQVLANMKNALWISLKNYPKTSLPTNFQPTKLGCLTLRQGLQKELWQGFKLLPNLKILGLQSSKYLKRTPDFNGLPCLERINLMDCLSLKEIHPSIGYHERLVYVNVIGCEKLKMFPPIKRMQKLETLHLSWCVRLRKFPKFKCNMDSLKELHLRQTAIEIVPSSVGEYCTNLVSLDLANCHKLKRIECNFRLFKHLKECYLDDRFSDVDPSDVRKQKGKYESDVVFDMHDLIEEMAHYIVRGKDTNYPEKHSWVWKSDDAMKVLDAVNTDMYSSTSTTMPKELTITDKVIKEHGRAVVSLEIILHINEALQKSHRPHLKDELCVYERLHGDLKKHGDYICKNILHVCHLLRSKDPNLFKKTSPKTIAKAIMDNFPKSDMLEELKLFDVGFLTFRLNSYWIAKRIHKNLKDGIVAWAPIALAERVIVDFPSQDIDAEMHADGVRSGYIRDMLVRMLEYCGVEVSGRMHNKQSLREVKKYFPEEEGVIRNKKLEPLFIVKEKASSKAQPNNVYEDLASLWCGAYVQNAQWIIYVTPVRQREYIMKCFTAARDFVNKDHTFMCYLGYQTSGDEHRKLALLWNAFESWYKRKVCDSYVEEGIALGYSSEAVFECSIKYTYLKNQTYSGCTFGVEEMFFAERFEDEFLYLIKTQFKIRQALKHPRPNNRSNKALVGSERELGLQLLQFTEIIQESILSVRPHWLCEYLLNLSKNFTSYIHEVRPGEINFLLCEATGVVMEKCFDLLGIGPEYSKGLPSYLKQQSGNKFAIRDHYISLHVDSPKPSSRFELFSMYIEVSHSNCEKSNLFDLFGRITVSDASGLRSDAWCDVDEKGCGHVAYFDHDWHDSIVIKDSSFLSFDDPASRHSVALSSLSIKIGVHLWVTSKEKDACYQLCDVTDEEIKLSGFWSGNQSIEHSTFYAEGVNGSVSLYYFLLKKVVDTSMRLEYEPINSHPKVHGRILAYYGGDALDSCVGFDKKLYKAVIFEMVPTKLEEKSNLPLKKSALAVPTNGILVFEASFKDADSGEILVDEKIEYHEKDQGKDSKWIINGKTCCFTLTVNWIRGEDCS